MLEIKKHSNMRSMFDCLIIANEKVQSYWLMVELQYNEVLPGLFSPLL